MVDKLNKLEKRLANISPALLNLASRINFAAEMDPTELCYTLEQAFQNNSQCGIKTIPDDGKQCFIAKLALAVALHLTDYKIIFLTKEELQSLKDLFVQGRKHLYDEQYAKTLAGIIYGLYHSQTGRNGDHYLPINVDNCQVFYSGSCIFPFCREEYGLLFGDLDIPKCFNMLGWRMIKSMNAETYKQTCEQYSAPDIIRNHDNLSALYDNEELNDLCTNYARDTYNVLADIH